MKKILDFVKLWWGKFVNLTKKKNFLLIFPSIGFVALAFFAHSVLAVIFLAIEVFAIWTNRNGD